MASIENVQLSIQQTPGTANVTVSVNYKVVGSQEDKATGLKYRETCHLIGDDTPGDGTDDILFMLTTRAIVFSESRPEFSRSIRTIMTLVDLDEDHQHLFQEDEIRARVTLVPLVPAAVSRESNLVKVGGPVISQTPA